MPAVARNPRRSYVISSAMYRSAEGERESLDTGIEKFDLEPSIIDRLRLTDQLIRPLLDSRAVALLVNVESVSSARRLPIERHAKAHGRSP